MSSYALSRRQVLLCNGSGPTIAAPCHCQGVIGVTQTGRAAILKGRVRMVETVYLFYVPVVSMSFSWKSFNGDQTPLPALWTRYFAEWYSGWPFRPSIVSGRSRPATPLC